MTRIVDGYAQPDVVAEKDGKRQAIFVETPESLRENLVTLLRSLMWYKENEPKMGVRLVQVVPGRGKR